MSSASAYITKPIDSLAELVNWRYDVPNLLTNPLQKCDFYWDDAGIKHNSSNIPQIIYCHDMAGGYLESDKTTGFTPVFPAFRFTRWHLIDIFIYFSHHFVTIPPISWINLAHRQGVRVYGTVIIESSHNDAFETIFVNPSSIANCKTNESQMNFEEFAYRLNEIRRLIGFEGWLINFEVSLPQNKVIEVRQRICQFLRLLKVLGSELVWYDAVGWSGNLNYQNCLTDENRPFFEACQGGLFLNYNWNSKLLRTTQNNAESSFVSSKVFVGIDCFGRGCPGNGGFGTSIALQMILDAVREVPTRPLSVALFAPGWVFEKCSPPDRDLNPANAFVELARTDWKFWSLLEPLIGQLRGAATSNRTRIYRPSLPCLPVVSVPDGTVNYRALEHGLLVQTDCCSGQGFFGNPKHSDLTRIGSCMNWQQIVPTCRDLTPNRKCPTYEVVHWIQSGCEPGRSTCLRVCPVDTDSECLDHPIFMELFSFGSNTLLSSMARFSVTISPDNGFKSGDQISSPKNNAMGLQLFADHGDGNQVLQRTILDPLSETLIVFNDKLWLRLEFELTSHLPLIRVGLSWIRSRLRSSKTDGFLVGQLKLNDPSWPLGHA